VDLTSLPLGICVQDEEHVRNELIESEQLQILLGSRHITAHEDRITRRVLNAGGTYGEYYFKLTSLDDLDNAIDGAWLSEGKKPVKMNICFEYIMQTFVKKADDMFEDPTYEYEYVEATLDLTYKNIPLVVSENGNLELFKENARKKVTRIHEGTQKQGSAHKVFMITGCMIVCYRLLPIGSASAALQPHIKNYNVVC
jgi:hypothetical protein